MRGRVDLDRGNRGGGPHAEPEVSFEPREPPRGAPGWLALAVVLAVVAVAVAATWGYALAVEVFGPAAPLAAGIAGAALLALLLPWALVRLHRPLGAIIEGVARSVAAGLRALRGSALARFVEARFARATTRGLALTAGVVALAALVAGIADLLAQVVNGAPLVGTDLRVANLAATLRTPDYDRAMYLISYLGGGQVVTALTVLGIAAALLAGRRLDAALLAGTVPGAALSAQVVKALVARPRPPLADARLIETSYSFPSEHATLAVALYGTAAFLLIRAVRPEAVRALTGMAAALLALAIGVSRVYLGVHYPSDVLAGWALGGAWVALATVVADVGAPMAPSLARGRRVAAATGTALLAALAVGYLAYAFPPLPPAPVAPTPSPEVVAPDAVAQTVLAHLPHYTEGLAGDREEPVNIVLVGTPSELEHAFAQAGWTQAQRLTLGVLGKAIVAALARRPDPAGPVTPDFLANEPETLAFSQPVGTTFAQRHHIRIWATDVVTGAGENVWLATASFDQGFELAGGFLPTHHINPDIDAERDYVGRSLGGAYALAGSQLVQLVPPESGHNFAGDPFYTNGQAFVLYLA